MLDRLVHYARLLGPRGVYAGVAGKLGRSPRVLSHRHGNLAHPLLLRVPSTDVDAYRQIFVEEQYRFDVSRPPRVIVDAGANIGLASVYFASRFPSARIFAIECEKSNFELLSANVRPYPTVTAIHAALWNEDGEIDIVDPGLGQWGFMTAAKGPGASVSSVRSATLDSIRREHGIGQIDILKIDIEGAELEVFNACSGWIDHVDTIVAELHDRLKAGCERSFAEATAAFGARWRQGENVYASRQESCVLSAA